MADKSFTLTKRIAKHGDQAIIVIPRLLEEHLKPSAVVEVKLNILENMNSPVQEHPLVVAQ